MSLFGPEKEGKKGGGLRSITPDGKNWGGVAGERKEKRLGGGAKSLP